MSYEKINFKDYPNVDTPIDTTNLNKMDQGIYDNSIAIDTLDKKIEKVNSNFKSIESTNLSETSETIDKILIDTTIENAGTYLLVANIPINFLGGTNRDISIKIYVDDVINQSSSYVINNNAYTVTFAVCKIINVSENGNLKIAAQNSLGVPYSISPFETQLIKLI